MGIVLHGEEACEIAGHLLAAVCDLAQQVDGLTVILSSGTSTKVRAACGVRCGDTSEHGKGRRHARRRDFVLLESHEFRGIQECPRVFQSDPRPGGVAALSASGAPGTHGRLPRAGDALRSRLRKSFPSSVIASRRSSSMSGSRAARWASRRAASNWRMWHLFPVHDSTLVRNRSVCSLHGPSSSAVRSGRSSRMSTSESASPSPRAMDPNNEPCTGRTCHARSSPRSRSTNERRRFASTSTADHARWSRLAR